MSESIKQVESGDGLLKLEEMRKAVVNTLPKHNYGPDVTLSLIDQLSESRQRERELVELLKKSMQLASIGYRIGEADMRGHDKIGERYGKQQDELIAEIKAAITEKVSSR